MKICDLFDLAKARGIEVPKGSDYISYINEYLGIKPLWGGSEATSFVIGIIVNGREFRYPFEYEDFNVVSNIPITEFKEENK